jgi:hypothetical protein
MVPGVLFIFAMIFQPESPRWLIEHEQYETAAIVLARTSGKDVDDPAVVQTMEDIKQELVGKEPLSILQQICRIGESRHVALRCFIPSLVMFFQQVNLILWTTTRF